jgi:hypothetical protein
MDDDLQRRTAGHCEPPLRQRQALGHGEGAALASRATDERVMHAGLQQVSGLGLDDGEVERTIGVKRSVGSGDEAVKWGVSHAVDE